MSSSSDITPLQTIRLTRPRPPKGRRIVVLEWNKLFAEAAEKDTKEGKDITAEEDECIECEHEYESDYEETEEHENNAEMPLNLCHKSKTVPIMRTHFETSENSLELSKSAANRCKGNESDKNCTVPNFQTNNYQEDFIISKSEGNKSTKSSQDKKSEVENISKGMNGNVLHSNFSTRTPMKEVNNVDSNILTGRRKASLDKLSTVSEKSLKSQGIAKQSQNPYPDDSKKIQENNIKNSEMKNCKLNKGSTTYSLERVNEKPTTGDGKSDQSNQSQDHARFAVPAAPQKNRSSGKCIIINGKSYQALAPLGKGGSSYVYLVLNAENELLAVKCVKLSGVSESIKNDYLNEIQHLLRMQHSKHVIRLYDHQYLPGNKLLYVVMEKGDTDLSRFLKDKAASEEGITPELILYYWNEMLLAVKSIHDNNIIHRDLKPANFLLVSGRLKLIDFGIASSIQNEQTSILMDTQSGTFNYMSPEALLDLGSGSEVVLKIGRKSDVWSLGCILYYFLYKKTPYQDIIKPLLKMRAITDPNHEVKFPKLPGMPDVLIESCKRCLVHDRKKRASIEELLELKNRPLLTLNHVLTKLKSTLTESEYEKAEKALTEELDE